MKRILISLFLLLSALSFSEVKEIQMIGLSGNFLNQSQPQVVRPQKEKQIKPQSQIIENGNSDKKIEQIVEKRFKDKKTEVLTPEEEVFVREYTVGMKDYRSQTLKKIERQMANKYNREQLKDLNAEYDRQLRNYLEQVGYSSDRIFFLANQYMMMNDYEKANKIFLLDNNDFKNVFGAATTFRFLGKNEEAIEKYTEAISRDSSFAESYLGRALANRNLDNYDSAVDDLKTYISMSGKEEGYLALGDIYFKLEKNEEAYNIVNQGLAKYPNSKLLKTLATNIYKN